MSSNSSNSSPAVSTRRISFSNARKSQEEFFENLITPERAAELLGLQISTIYNWKYHQKKLNVPEDLFIPFNRRLYLNIEVLKAWITSQRALESKSRR